MMQVNGGIGTKHDAALSAVVVLCLQHLESQSRVCSSSNCPLCTLLPVVTERRIVRTVSSTHLDVARDRRVRRIEQGRRWRPEYPISVSDSFEVALFHPRARLLWVAAFGPLPQHLPVAMSDISKSIFGCAVPIVVCPTSDDGIEQSNCLLRLGLFVGVEHRFDVPQMLLHLFFLRCCQQDAVVSSDGKAQKIEAFIIAMNDACLDLVHRQATFGHEGIQSRLDIFQQHFARWSRRDKIVGVSDQADASVLPFSPGWRDEPTGSCFTTEQPFHSIQSDVCQQGLITPPCGTPLSVPL